MSAAAILLRGRLVSRRLQATTWVADRRLNALTILTLLYLLTFSSGIAASRMPPNISLQLRKTPTGQLQIAWILPGGNLWYRGLRPGDSVLSLDNTTPGSHSTGSWTGMQITALRPNGLTVRAEVRDMAKGTDAWPLLLLSPWFFLFGVLHYLRAKPAALGIMAFALFGLAAEVLALGPVADSNHFVLGQMAERALVPFFAANFAAFFLVFPTARAMRASGWVWVFLPAALAGALDIWGTAVPAIYPFSNAVWLVLLICYLVLGVGLAVWAFITARGASDRRGLRAIAIATALAVVPFVAFSLAPLLLGFPQILSAEHAVLAAALLPAGFAYATLRHDVVDVPLLQRWLVHCVLGAGILSLYSLSAFAFCLRVAVLPLSPPDLAVLITLLALVAGGTFQRLYLPLQRVVDGLLFKDEYDYRKSLLEFSRRLSLGALLDTSMDSLLVTLRRLMNLQFVSLLVRLQGQQETLESAGAAPDDLLASVVALLSRTASPPRLHTVSAGGGTVLLAPLATQDSVVGCLCLGAKRSSEPFRSWDETFLLTVAGQLSTTILNMHLTDTLRSQVVLLNTLNGQLERAQEEERALLASEIHDESLQTALQLQRQLAEEGDSRALALVRALVDQLRTVCMKVRPAALDELGLAAALEQLAIDLSGRTGYSILVDADPGIAEVPLSPEAELTLYRAAQEALNNAIKHARATTLLVLLRCDSAAVELCITDDGCGFEMPSSLGSLLAAGHLGLVGLQQRVQRSGGTVEIDSQACQGTTVNVRLPVRGDRR